jgi:hypothetical protein
LAKYHIYFSTYKAFGHGDSKSYNCRKKWITGLTFKEKISPKTAYRLSGKPVKIKYKKWK